MKTIVIIRSPRVDYQPMINWLNQFNVSIILLDYKPGCNVPKNSLIIVGNTHTFGPDKCLVAESFCNNYFIGRILKPDKGTNQPVIFFGNSSWFLFKHYNVIVKLSGKSTLTESKVFSVKDFNFDQFGRCHINFGGIPTSIPKKLTMRAFITIRSKSWFSDLKSSEKKYSFHQMSSSDTCVTTQLIGRPIFTTHILPWKTKNTATSQNYKELKYVIGDPISNNLIRNILYAKDIDTSSPKTGGTGDVPVLV